MRKKRLVRKDYKDFDSFVEAVKKTLPPLVSQETMYEESFYVFALFGAFRYGDLPPDWFVQRFEKRFGKKPEKAVLFEQGETLMLGLGSVPSPVEVS